MILKIFAIGFLLAALLCVWLAQVGDNPDARALAGIFYFPAIALGVIDAVLWFFVLR